MLAGGGANWPSFIRKFTELAGGAGATDVLTAFGPRYRHSNPCLPASQNRLCFQSLPAQGDFTIEPIPICCQFRTI